MLLSNNFGEKKMSDLNLNRIKSKLKEYIAFFLSAYCWIGVLLAFGYSESLPWFLAAVPWTFISLGYFNKASE